MAGESPDRSKQRESSVEPTSGKAGPVPEARDPRSAVSRDSDERGGVDTATRVLSTRDLKSDDEPPAQQEDARLREAVAAWVRSGDSAEGEEPAKGSPPDASAAEAAGPDDAEARATEGEKAEDDDAEGAERTADDSEAAQDDAGEDDEAAAQAGSDAETDMPDEHEDAAADSDSDADADKPANTDESDSASSDEDAAANADEGADAAADADEDEDEDEEAAADADEPTDTEPEADVAGEADAAAEPAPADGDSAPQGPPAPDDESRTGGAGGNTKAEGEAEATDTEPDADTDATDEADGEGEAEAKPVDQPTAVFKAPRQVDQPTTMLKLGGKPKAESDPERTSKFVALKPLDDPSTRKPEPKPAAPKPAPTAKPAAAPPADATTPVPQIGPERTTQQPLPPKPPLDLLAELTNTPPPPETPVRTIVRRVKIWTPLALLLAVVFAVVQAMRPLPAPTLALTAEETYTFDGRTSLPWPGEGQGWMDVNGIGTMGNFGKQTPVAIGSVAKTMTTYIILKEHPLKPGAEGPSITVDATAEKEGGYNKAGESTLDTVKEGDKLTEKQAISAVMIPSANNIARLLARWDAGSEAAFVKKMNATAKKLGMTHTTYTDPSGLKETTVSTAEDQVKLGNEVVKNPVLTAITSAASWDDPTHKNWSNPNTLPYVMGAIGIKTGSTTAAGGNLLFAARREVGGETVTVVGAILGQHKPDILATVNAVSKTALTAAKGALTSAKILKKGDVVGYVDDGLGGRTPVVVTKDVTAVGWAGLKAKLSFAPDKVPHTAKAGTQVGTLTVGDGKSGAVKVPVALKKDLTEPGLGSKLTRIR